MIIWLEIGLSSEDILFEISYLTSDEDLIFAVS